MPGLDGLAVCRRVRARGLALPILLLTARDAVEDRVTGLDAGADDYLVKPFDLEELAARVRAVSRRNEGRATPHATYNDVTLNPARLSVTVSGDCIGLSRREFAVLAALMDRPGAVLSKSDLEAKLYGWQEEVESNTVEVHVHKLRSKIGRTKIETLRGIGYRMRPVAS
jgi:two-component system response regulator QseB